MFGPGKTLGTVHSVGTQNIVSYNSETNTYRLEPPPLNYKRKYTFTLHAVNHDDSDYTFGFEVFCADKKLLSHVKSLNVNEITCDMTDSTDGVEVGDLCVKLGAAGRGVVLSDLNYKLHVLEFSMP